MVRPAMLRRRVPAVATLAALCALTLAACGGSVRPSASPTATTTAATAVTTTAATASTTGTATTPARDPHTLYIYSSLPQSGPERRDARAIQEGITLALDRIHHRTRNGYRLRYRPRSDATRVTVRRGRRRLSGTNGWNPSATVRVAEEAAANPQTVAFIGDLDSGATQLSLPILNQAGIVQITPGSGYPGLTDDVRNVTLPGEPAKYYPQRRRTLLRMIPNDLVQAAAALEFLQKAGCQHVSAWSFGDGVEGPALVKAVMETAVDYKMAFYKPPPLGTDTKTFYSYAVGLRGHINCAVLAGHPTHAAELFTEYLYAQVQPVPTIVGTSGFCNAGWPAGVPQPVRHALTLYCTTPLRQVNRYPASADFILRFRHLYHREPPTYAYYGYEAAKLVIASVEDLSGRSDNRAGVMAGLVNGLASAELGTFTFTNNGNLTSATYGLDRIVDGAAPKPYLRLDPPTWLSSEP